MNPVAEMAIIVAALVLTAAFIVWRLVKTLKGKPPSCCSGTKGG
jgi:hypothetical protein